MFLRYTSAAGVQSDITTDADGDSAGRALRYLVDAHHREPLIVLRGRDLLILPMIREYGHLTQNTLRGGEDRGPVLECVKRDFDKAAAWQAANGRLLKYADRPVPKGT